MYFPKYVYFFNIYNSRHDFFFLLLESVEIKSLDKWIAIF